MRAARAVADTSVWIAGESERPLDADALPHELLVCTVTLAELEAGVLAAQDVSTRADRLATLELARRAQVLAIDSAAASQWARLRVELYQARRRVNVNDLWIAATALAHDLPVVTQDDGFDPLTALAPLTVIKV